MAEAKTITEFLRNRGENPDHFERVIKFCGDKMEYRSGFFDTSYGCFIMDIKRINLFDVVLRRKIYWSGYPGIRRESKVSVFSAEGIMYEAEEAYIDGRRQTHHLDRNERAFDQIVTARCQDADTVIVQLRNGDVFEADMRCVRVVDTES